MGEILPKINVVRLRYRVVKLVLVAVFQWLETGRSTIINQNIAESAIIRSFRIELKIGKIIDIGEIYRPILGIFKGYYLNQQNEFI